MTAKNMAIVGAVIVAAAATTMMKHRGQAAGKVSAPAREASAKQGQALPRLVDLGAGKCIPCKAMKPILEDLAAHYAGTFKTEFIDVWENEGAGREYGINMIPTQIFFGSDGKELFRHEGFFAKEDILAKWKELGVGMADNNSQR